MFFPRKKTRRALPPILTGLIAGLLFSATARAVDFTLTWHTIDGGGATFSSGGNFSLGGTIGQPDAGVMAGGNFMLAGGFWAGADPCGGRLPCDANCDGTVDFFDIDPFILALLDPAAYAANYPGCDRLCAADVNRDGTLDFFDIDPFIVCVLGAP